MGHAKLAACIINCCMYHRSMMYSAISYLAKRSLRSLEAVVVEVGLEFARPCSMDYELIHVHIAKFVLCV